MIIKLYGGNLLLLLIFHMKQKKKKDNQRFAVSVFIHYISYNFHFHFIIYWNNNYNRLKWSELPMRLRAQQNNNTA